MLLSAYHVLPYRLALRRPWRTAAGVVLDRRGWLVRLDDGGGCFGWGDCAPMPEIGTESRHRAAAVLSAAAQALMGSDPEEAALPLPGGAPAVRCALDTALLDIAARLRGCSAAHRLNREAAERVAVNAACGALDGTTIRRCRSAIDSGFQVLKLKVGLSTPAAEVKRLLVLSAVLPSGVLLRLDANCAWSLADARFVVDALAGAPIESLEEPLRIPSLERLKVLQQQAMFPLALDESLSGLDKDALLLTRPVSRLILKPMAAGGPRAVMALARRAAAAGIESVITTSVDSAVGVAVCLHLAAALDNGLAHGLATSEWLASDVAIPIPISGGLMRVPPVLGLGVGPVLDSLTPYKS